MKVLKPLEALLSKLVSNLNFIAKVLLFCLCSKIVTGSYIHMEITLNIEICNEFRELMRLCVCLCGPAKRSFSLGL